MITQRGACDGFPACCRVPALYLPERCCVHQNSSSRCVAGGVFSRRSCNVASARAMSALISMRSLRCLALCREQVRNSRRFKPNDARLPRERAVSGQHMPHTARQVLPVYGGALQLARAPSLDSSRESEEAHQSPQQRWQQAARLYTPPGRVLEVRFKKFRNVAGTVNCTSTCAKHNLFVHHSVKSVHRQSKSVGCMRDAKHEARHN